MCGYLTLNAQGERVLGSRSSLCAKVLAIVYLGAGLFAAIRWGSRPLARSCRHIDASCCLGHFDISRVVCSKLVPALVLVWHRQEVVA